MVTAEQAVTELEFFVDAVHDEARLRLGGMIPRPAEANRFLVLNPLG